MDVEFSYSTPRFSMKKQIVQTVRELYPRQGPLQREGLPNLRMENILRIEPPVSVRPHRLSFLWIFSVVTSGVAQTIPINCSSTRVRASARRCALPDPLIKAAHEKTFPREF